VQEKIKKKLILSLVTSKTMGVDGLWAWLRAMKCPSDVVVVPNTSRLVVDAKLFMRKLAAQLPSESPNFHQDLANLMARQFKRFAHVTFVNDGQLTADHAKNATCKLRSVARAKARDVCTVVKQELDAVKTEMQTNPQLEHKLRELEEKLEQKQKNARSITFEDTLKVMQYLEAYENFTCFQVNGEEADGKLVACSAEFDYCVSEDGDLLCAGVDNLLVHFGTAKQAVYSATKIITFLDISLRQLQDMATLIGNDYVPKGVKGIGPVEAYRIVKKHGNALLALKREGKDPQTIPNDFHTCRMESFWAYSQHCISREELIALCEQEKQEADAASVDECKQVKKPKKKLVRTEYEPLADDFLQIESQPVLKKTKQTQLQL
jgi:5'-3' exonuclease